VPVLVAPMRGQSHAMPKIARLAPRMVWPVRTLPVRDNRPPVRTFVGPADQFVSNSAADWFRPIQRQCERDGFLQVPASTAASEHRGGGDDRF
jgi:hypothetical protein